MQIFCTHVCVAPQAVVGAHSDGAILEAILVHDVCTACMLPEELEPGGELLSPSVAQSGEFARKIGPGPRHTPQTAPEISALTISLSPASKWVSSLSNKPRQPKRQT